MASFLQSRVRNLDNFSKRRSSMFRQPGIYSTIILFVATLSMTLSFSSSAVAEEDAPEWEKTDLYQECTDRTDCPSGFACMDTICIDAGELTIVQKKALFQEPGKKIQKTQFGDHRRCRFQSLRWCRSRSVYTAQEKAYANKGQSKLTLRGAVGFPAGTYEIWVGNFKGNITISGEFETVDS